MRERKRAGRSRATPARTTEEPGGGGGPAELAIVGARVRALDDEGWLG